VIDRPVRYGWGHNPHDEDGVVFEDPWMWLDLDETVTQWQQSAAPDSTPKADG